GHSRAYREPRGADRRPSIRPKGYFYRGQIWRRRCQGAADRNPASQAVSGGSRPARGDSGNLHACAWNARLKPARNPWMKFYPADWRSDAMLRLCSIAARGLWAEMMCLMHEAERYGSLLVNGKRIDKKQLAGLAGISEKDCSVLLLELEGNGVFSRDEDGTIYSRRMRRDDARSEEGRKQVAKRWGDRGPNRSDGRSPATEPITQKPEARSQKLEKKDTREDALFAAMEAFWSIWPNKVGKPAALKALRSAVDRATISEICEGVE